MIDVAQVEYGNPELGPNVSPDDCTLGVLDVNTIETLALITFRLHLSGCVLGPMHLTLRMYTPFPLSSVWM